jgi:CRP-like cAMP-binding protein
VALSWKCFDARLVLLQGVLAVAWALAIVRVVDHLAGRALLVTLKQAGFVYWERAGGLLLGALTLTAALGLVSLLAEHHLAEAVVTNWRGLRDEFKRWLRRRPADEKAWKISALIRKNPVLRRLDNDTQRKLAARMRLFETKPWKMIVEFDKVPPFVGIIVRGRAVAYRRGLTGRKSRFLNLCEGDFFGGNELVDPEKNSLEVRSATPLVALVMELEDFEQLVVAKLGAAALWDQTSKQVFLRRSSLCSEWRATSVARFSELAVLSQKCPAGAVVRNGQPVRSLYVMYEGRAKALRDGKEVGEIDTGEFFGELSLLQMSAATADVETSEGGRFLTVDRLDFIKFLSRNYNVALQMERLCSRRLGRPLFPLDQRAFDER